MEIREQIEAGNCYHICTKANGGEHLFRDHTDYSYFIRKMELRLTEAWSIIAFTLLPGEIHLVVRITKKKIDGETVNHSMLLSHLLNGYVQHYNRKYSRTGSLLNRSFRRKRIKSKKDLRDMICKVHNLPVARELVETPEKWLHSSFKKVESKISTNQHWLSELMSFFGNMNEYRNRHQDESSIVADLEPRKSWMKILCALEIAFRISNPLGVHRWCRRIKCPP